MNNNLLRAPLIKSAVLLAIFSLLVYLTITSSEGSVLNSLETIFLAVFRAAQLGVGLILALFLCFVVLLGIFLGGVAMVSRSSAAKMYDQLRTMVSEKLHFLKSLLRKEERPISTGPDDIFSPQLEKEIKIMLDSSIEPVRSEQSAFQARIKGLLEKIEEIEQNGKSLELAERVEHQADRIDELGEAVDQVKESLSELRDKIDQFMLNQQKLTVESMLNDLSGRVAELEDMHRDNRAHGEEHSLEDESGLRLFSYLDDPEARTEIEQLVNDALQQDMTYAQATDFILENTEASTAEVLRAHPSLTKDYIRYQRQKR